MRSVIIGKQKATPVYPVNTDTIYQSGTYGRDVINLVVSYTGHLLITCKVYDAGNSIDNDRPSQQTIYTANNYINLAPSLGSSKVVFAGQWNLSLAVRALTRVTWYQFRFYPYNPNDLGPWYYFAPTTYEIIAPGGGSCQILRGKTI